MKDTNNHLDELLRKSRVPERSAGYWQNFPKRVTARLSAAAQFATAPPPNPPHAWVWGLASVFIVLLLCLGLWVRNRATTVWPDYAKLYEEIHTMFPNQVRAIIIGQTGVTLDLSDRPDVPSSPPVRVNVCRQQQCLTYITFSGQSIRLNGETCDVLADGQGHISLVGRDIVWTSADPGRRPEAYHIEADVMRVQS